MAIEVPAPTGTVVVHPVRVAGLLSPYHPPIFFWWWFACGAYAPDIFAESGDIAASCGILSATVAIAMPVWCARKARNAETYGSARWATPQAIKAPSLRRRRSACRGASRADTNRTR